MDCRTFAERLDTWLDGTPSAGERDAMEAHARACPRCTELRALVQDGLAAPPVSAPVELARRVLAETTGSACPKAETWLPQLVEGTLDREDDAELLRSHVSRCRDCTALLDALERLAIDLPRLVELVPAPDFAGAVLARTTRAVPRATQGFWQRIVLRPRLALEGAYLASLVVAGLLGLGGGGRALEETLAHLRSASQAVGAQVSSAVPATIEVLEDSWNETAVPFRRAATRVRTAFEPPKETEPRR